MTRRLTCRSCGEPLVAGTVSVVAGEIDGRTALCEPCIAASVASDDSDGEKLPDRGATCQCHGTTPGIFPRPGEKFGDWIDRVNPTATRYPDLCVTAAEQEAFSRGQHVGEWARMFTLFDSLAWTENDGLRAWLAEMARLLALRRVRSTRDFRLAIERHMAASGGRNDGATGGDRDDA